MNDATRVSLAVFIITLPLLVVCILAWLIGGFWGFPLAYIGAWFIVGCVISSLKLLEGG